MPDDPAALLPRLAEIAGRMNSLKKAKDATLGYDALADAVWWSDERPANLTSPATGESCLRLLLRYRTSLILGTPDEGLKPFWDAARRQFPGWPGFVAARRFPTEELRAFYARSKAAAGFSQEPPPSR